jgi:hypothetical protein
MEQEKILSENEKKALTSIRAMYTLSNTREEVSELDRLAVSNFLHTLAEVTLAVAVRKQNSSKTFQDHANGERCKLYTGQ